MKRGWFPVFLRVARRFVVWVCAGSIVGFQYASAEEEVGETRAAETETLVLESEDLPEPLPDDDLSPSAREAILRGNAAFERGDYRAARDAYVHVRATAPGNLLALVNLGLAEYYLGNAEEAESLLREAVRRRLETAPAWLVLGMIYMDNDRLEEALAALAQANLHDPGNPRGRNFMGVVTGRMGWNDAAESELRKALEIDPRYADAHFNLAFFYLQRRHPAVELARRHYQRALELGAERDPELEKLLEQTTKTDNS